VIREPTPPGTAGKAAIVHSVVEQLRILRMREDLTNEERVRALQAELQLALWDEDPP
jgi:hypothetical protein